MFGLAIGALILFVEFMDAAVSVKLYEVEYRIECVECDCVAIQTSLAELTRLNPSEKYVLRQLLHQEIS